MGCASAVAVAAIGATGPPEVLLRQVSFDDVAAGLIGLRRVAVRLGIARPQWQPTFLVAEGEGVYGFCLDNPSHSSGPGEIEILQSAMARLWDAVPRHGDLEWVLYDDFCGRPYAAAATFRLRTEHWRGLARGIWQSLPKLRGARGSARREGLLSSGVALLPFGGDRNPLRAFAGGLRSAHLVALAEGIARSGDPLHLRLSFVLHLMALRRVRTGDPTGRARLAGVLRVLESEAWGEYHLDGQAALRMLQEAPWDERYEVFEI